MHFTWIDLIYLVRLAGSSSVALDEFRSVA